MRAHGVSKSLTHSAISGPLGTGATPEEALADLREARQSLIALMLERGDPVPEPPPVRANARA